MADKKNTPAKKAASNAPAKKRQVKTPEQRIAEAEAKLEALREAAKSSNDKRVAAIDAKLAKLEPKVADLQKQVDDLKTQKARLTGDELDGPPGGTDGVGEPDEG